MSIKIIEVGSERLAEYARIPIKVEVRERLEVELVEGGLGGMLLHLVPVSKLYIKDYDSYGEIPADWPEKFDTSNWGFFLAMEEDKYAGGATVAFNTQGVNMLKIGKTWLYCGTQGWTLLIEVPGSRYSDSQPIGPGNTDAGK